jgi:hypothetical protein
MLRREHRCKEAIPEKSGFVWLSMFRKKEKYRKKARKPERHDPFKNRDFNSFFTYFKWCHVFST